MVVAIPRDHLEPVYCIDTDLPESSTMFPPFTKTTRSKTYDHISPSRAELSCAGKNVLITGGGGGVGVFLARSFAEAGASSVVIIGRTESTLKATIKTIKQHVPSANIEHQVADITSSDLTKIFKHIAYRHGPINILINNAAVTGKFDSIVTADQDTWFAPYLTNVKGSLNVVQAFMNVASENPTIVNITAASAHFGAIPTWSSYNSSKLASIQMFAHLQAENPSLHIVQVHPGIVESAMTVATGVPNEYKNDGRCLCDSSKDCD